MTATQQDERPSPSDTPAEPDETIAQRRLPHSDADVIRVAFHEPLEPDAPGRD